MPELRSRGSVAQLQPMASSTTVTRGKVGRPKKTQTDRLDPTGIYLASLLSQTFFSHPDFVES